MTPAAELRAAASKIRETAAAATEGPWYANTDSVCTDWDPDSHGFKMAGYRDKDVTVQTLPDDAAHIALWHPGVAELVAVWLVAEADHFESLWKGPHVPGQLARALAVARAINGTEEA